MYPNVSKLTVSQSEKYYIIHVKNVTQDLQTYIRHATIKSRNVIDD